MFNLLESLATDAGCSEEAWELVAEFAATDLTLDGSETRERLWGSDVHPPHVFDVPAEAMLTCLTRDSRAWAEPELLDLCTSREWLRADLFSEFSQDLSDGPTSPGNPGFGPGAFSSRTRDHLLDLEELEDERDWELDELRCRRGYREGGGR
jgi:hypothetical protein